MPSEKNATHLQDATRNINRVLSDTLWTNDSNNVGVASSIVAIFYFYFI